jgi:DNA polymerase-3 subunit epsilon
MSEFERLRQIVNEPFYVLDTETTGLKHAEIVQIAIVDNMGVAILNTLIRPTKPIPAEATAVHGITDDSVRNAPPWSEVRGELCKIIRSENVVVYNATFDRNMLYSTDEHCGLNLEPRWLDYCNWFCAMNAFAEYYGDWNDYHKSYRWQKLGFAAKIMGIAVPEDAHTALSDCMSTMKLIKAMYEDKP